MKLNFMESRMENRPHSEMRQKTIFSLSDARRMTTAVRKHLRMAIRAETDIRAVDQHEDLRHAFPSHWISGIGSTS